MKRKSLIILFVVAVAIAFTFVPAKSHAAMTQGWHTVTIDSAGPFFGKIIMLVDAANGSFTNQWLVFDATMQNSLLATALSAISLQQQARVWVSSTTQALPGITPQICTSVLLQQ